MRQEHLTIYLSHTNQDLKFIMSLHRDKSMLEITEGFCHPNLAFATKLLLKFQAVTISMYLSNFSLITSDVPQGFLLGSLLESALNQHLNLFLPLVRMEW